MRHIAMTLSFSIFSVVALGAPLKGAVYSPEAGILCDKKAGFCADSQGISMAFTKQFLGEKAEKKMMAQINQVGLENFDASNYTLTNGVSCNSKAQKCTVSKFSDRLDAAHTKALFGK